MPREPLPGGMADVEIEYCVPCGFLNRAVDLAEALLSTFGADIDSVSPVTGDHGVFEVRVDGTVASDKAEDGADETAVIRNRRFLVAHQTWSDDRSGCWCEWSRRLYHHDRPATSVRGPRVVSEVP